MCVSRVSSPRQREKETEEFSSDLVDTHVHVRLTYTLATLRVRATNKSPPSPQLQLLSPRARDKMGSRDDVEVLIQI